MSKASNNNAMGEDDATEPNQLTAKEQREIWWNWYDNLTAQQREEHYTSYSGTKIHRRIFHYDEAMLKLPGVQLVLEEYATMRKLYPLDDDV